MHVGVKEIVAEDLGEKDLHPAFGERLEVYAACAQGVDIAHRNAGDAFHDHDIGTASGPVDFRHVEHVGILEIAPQLRGIGRLAQQVEFVEDGLFELGDDLAWVAAAGFPSSRTRP